MEKVLIAAAPLTKDTDRRREAWRKLTQVPMAARILGCREEIEEDGWRFEVMNQPPAMALREWSACNKADNWTKKHLLQQMLEAVDALHAQGLVHLNIRPETIFIDEGDDRMMIVLGGLESVSLHNLPRHEAEASDPFYAPPESVDPGGLAPGIGLRAWDWWGVGRVMQELVFGRHVMSSLFGRDVVREPDPQLREQAVALLQERAPPGVRAGAVEAMGLTDLTTKEMLRGLLTSSRDARWGADAVRRWLAKENVSDHYDLARNARFFSWKGRGLTLAEAVRFFRTEANWAAGEQNIAEPENPETLSYFLSTVPDHAAAAGKLNALRAQMKSSPWSGVPPAIRCTVQAAIGWTTLESMPRAMIIQGRPVDAGGLAELLGRREEPSRCALVRALASAPSLELIRPLDPAAAQVLARLAETGVAALQRAEKHRWVNAEDPGEQAKVLRLALEPESALRTRADRVRATFATVREEELAKLLTDKAPAPWVNVLLVVTGEEPHRFGYVTKEAHISHHKAGVEAECQRLRGVLFWRRLLPVLRAGAACTGDRNEFVVLVAGLAALGLIVARDVPTTAGLLTALVGLRLLFVWRVRLLAPRVDPTEAPWSWRDGPTRGAEILQRLWPEGVAVPMEELMTQLAAAEEARAALLSEPVPLRTAAPFRLIEFRAGLALCALLSVAGSVQLMRSYGNLVGGDSADSFRRSEAIAGTAPAAYSAQSRNGSPPDPLLKIPGMTPELLAKVRKGEYEIVKGVFGNALHGPLVKWDLPPPARPAPLPVLSHVTATPEQRAFGLVSGELLVTPYGHKTVNALLGVRVPVPGGIGLMLYDVRARRLVDGDMLILGEPLADRTWYKLDRRKIIYLGEPEEMQDENSLALK